MVTQLPWNCKRPASFRCWLILIRIQPGSAIDLESLPSNPAEIDLYELIDPTTGIAQIEVTGGVSTAIINSQRMMLANQVFGGFGSIFDVILTIGRPIAAIGGNVFIEDFIDRQIVVFDGNAEQDSALEMAKETASSGLPTKLVTIVHGNEPINLRGASMPEMSRRRRRPARRTTIFAPV